MARSATSIVSVLCACLLVKDGAATSWSYEGRAGVSPWARSFPQCSGSHQSPVPINNRESVYRDFGNMIYTNYQNEPKSSVILNTGRTVQFTQEMDSDVFVSGSELPDFYKYVFSNFHWGSDSEKGSEHTVDGRQYPLELQLVHHKNKYKDIFEAANHYDGIAILSIMFKQSYFDNRQLEPIVKNLKRIRQPFSEKHLSEKIRLLDLLPLDTATYYRYGGSLTTPPCTEGVIWTVFEDTLPISERQLQEFRSLLNEEYDTTVDNFRSLQPVNGRAIYRSGRQSSYNFCVIPVICPYVEEILSHLFLNVRSAYNYAPGEVPTVQIEGQ